MLVAREDLALEAAFWAQLPGNFPFRPRKAPITSRNFAAMSPFHNFPFGTRTRQPLGRCAQHVCHQRPLAILFLAACQRSSDPDGGSRKDTGHTLICGPTGSGKTVFIGFLVAMLSRQGATQVIFDKDRGLEILVRALGGDYLPLKNGLPTGFNPLQLPITPANVEFLRVWLRELAAQATSDTRARAVRRRPIWIKHCAAPCRSSRRRGVCRGWWNFSIRPILKVCTHGSHAGASRIAATTLGYSTTRAIPSYRDYRDGP